MNPSKIVITGTSGSGKTYLGKKLSKILGHEHTDLDDLYWLPDWVERDKQEYLSLIQESINKEKWIICGNSSKVRDLIWSQADMIIWLDLPLPKLLWQGLKRTLNTWIKKQTTCNGNRESLGRLVGKDSILLWILKTYGKRKRNYSEYFKRNPEKKNLFHLRSSKEMDHLIGEFSKKIDA